MRTPDPDRISAPVEKVIIELKSGEWVRYASVNAAGGFVFDGLKPGDYQLTAYPAEFPASAKILAGPRRFQIEERGCATQVLVIP